MAGRSQSIVARCAYKVLQLGDATSSVNSALGRGAFRSRVLRCRPAIQSCGAAALSNLARLPLKPTEAKRSEARDCPVLKSCWAAPQVCYLHVQFLCRTKFLHGVVHRCLRFYNLFSKYYKQSDHKPFWWAIVDEFFGCCGYPD